MIYDDGQLEVGISLEWHPLVMAAWERELRVVAAPKSGLLHGTTRLNPTVSFCERAVSSSWKEVQLNHIGEWCDHCSRPFSREKRRVQLEVLDQTWRSGAQVEHFNRQRLLAEIAFLLRIEAYNRIHVIIAAVQVAVRNLER